MADTKITALTALTAADPANDVLPIVDVSDTTMAASGTTKKISVNNILGCSGTATLASATITGDLTVDTSTLKVNSTTDRVGIGTVSPGKRCEINQSANAITTIGAGEILRLIGDDGNTNGRITELGFGVGPTGATYAPITVGAVNTSVSGFGTKDFYVAARAGISDAAPIERYRIASDGVATWSNVGGVAGTAMTLNATGLGVGASPAERLTIGSSTAANYIKLTNTGATNGFLVGCYNTSVVIRNKEAGAMNFFTSDTQRMQIDSSGNVGIGVTPSATIFSGSETRLVVKGNANNFAGTIAVQSKGTGNLVTGFLAAADGVNSLAFGSASNSPINFYVNNAQAMTLDASGRLLVGQTSTGILNINGIDIEGGDSNGGSYIIINHKLATASGQQYVFFGYNGVKTGDITQNGTTGVLYNITSDYRLKEQVQPLVGGLARVNALKPSVYKWKSDGSNSEGFLAHELAEVVPFAVSGEKDAVNEDGSIKPQGIDMSRVVPILVAAIQELTARVVTLENA